MKKYSKRQLRPTLERFLSHIQVKDTGYKTPCWLWTGSITKNGYGTFYAPRGQQRSCCAHQWSYEYFVHIIPTKYTIDHLCRIRYCVHPEHLEATSHSINVLRGANSLLKPDKTSKYPGVHWCASHRRWRAMIRINTKQKILGEFIDEEAAYAAYIHTKEEIQNDHQRSIMA